MQPPAVGLLNGAKMLMRHPQIASGALVSLNCTAALAWR
jgi:hypothetical protein